MPPFSLPSSQIVEDRAVRTRVAVAMFHQLGKRRLHALQFGNLAPDVGDTALGDGLDVGASSAAVTIEIEQLAAFLRP